MAVGNMVPSGARLGLATLAVAAVTGLLAWLGAGVTLAAVVFVSLVVGFAAQTGMSLSVYVALLCALSFDYYFLPPYHTLWLAGPQEWVTLGAFFVCSLVVGRVAEQGRRDARWAEARRADVDRLYTLAQEMMLHESPLGLIRELPKTMARIFQLDQVVLYVRDEDQLHSAGAELPMGIEASLESVAEGQKPFESIPGGLTATALLVGLRPVGALAFATGGLSREVAAAVSAQVAILLARAAAVEAQTRIEAARESDRLRAALLDSLTHEFRTPLTSIRAAASTLRSAGDLDAETVTELATVVDEETARFDRLIGEAVEMAEIDADMVRVEVAEGHPRALMEQAVAALKDRLAGRHVSIAAEDPERTAHVDARLLARVLRHLLENAARFTPPGGRIVLRSRIADGRLEFRVEDEGPGVHPADLPYIFEKFYRGKRGQTGSQGTGMGLAIVRSILRAHGGGIEVEPGTGHGACFRFWVPEQGTGVSE